VGNVVSLRAFAGVAAPLFFLFDLELGVEDAVPDVLVADELTTALDMLIQAQIMELLGSLKERFSMSVILTMHNFGGLSRVAPHESGVKPPHSKARSLGLESCHGTPSALSCADGTIFRAGGGRIASGYFRAGYSTVCGGVGAGFVRQHQGGLRGDDR
jgi:hypothetical protein